MQLVLSDTFRDTYHTTTPSIWFQQTVNLALYIAIATVVINARDKVTNPPTERPSNKTYTADRPTTTQSSSKSQASNQEQKKAGHDGYRRCRRPGTNEIKRDDR